MAHATNVEQVAAYVDRLGVPPIVRLNHWVKAHTEFGSGTSLAWRFHTQAIVTLQLQHQEFKVLQAAIDTVSEPKTLERTMPGLLLGASITRHRFEMRLDTGEEIVGRFTDAISQEHTVVLPKHYQAVIRQTTQIKGRRKKRRPRIFWCAWGERCIREAYCLRPHPASF